MTLEEWLHKTHVLALKTFAEDMPGVHEAKKPKVIKYILDNPEARERAEESKSIEEKVLNR